jgi:hypothetical protein
MARKVIDFPIERMKTKLAIKWLRDNPRKFFEYTFDRKNHKLDSLCYFIATLPDGGNDGKEEA